MLVLRLLVMVLTIICLMDGHAEVLSSTTAMRNGGESSSLKQNEPEVQILDRKKKKKPKPGKKKKPKPNKKKKPKPNKAKPTPTKPVTTTSTISTSTLKTTTITTTARTTTTTVSPTTTATTAKTTPSTASATTTLSTTTSATTTAKTTSTATTTTTTISTSTSSPATTTATTADSGAGGECKATNGKPCIFPFKDGNEEYNECKNEGGKYFWCATSVYDSGKYKHWSYCPNDGSCPIPGDGECRATNNKPCVFPFKDGNKEYNECADYGGKYFWCATGTNSAGKYTAWSECPKDGSCPLPPKSTPPGATSTLTIATTTLPNTDCSCSDFMSSGYGQCKKGSSYLFGGSPFCYVNLPSNCPDLVESTFNQGKWMSAQPCNSQAASSMPVTTVSPQESASTTVLVKDGEKIFSCQMDFTFESTSGFKMNSNFSSSCSPGSSATKHYKNFDEYAFDITTSSGAEINCKINIVIQDETSPISMATKPMEKSLECSVDESKCVTISGEHFPTTCVVPFIHEGRKYQACTDKGGKDAGKLWCATAVDENEEMTKWGYCSAACGYCGGKDVTDQDTRAGGACGYDCFINPYKPMEPKTQGIDPKLLSAPEVSYYDDEMTVWNKLPNIQFQFLLGQPGVFLNCLDGFNHFPCHQSVYIKCDGNYRFSIYAAELKDDNTATIAEFIQNDVKNVQIGCGPCPMGFIYKVGDEVSTYLTSWGKYNGVPDIGACRDLCNDHDCPTFVYSLEDKYCELHSVRVENPSNPVFKDYRLCTREEENSCDATTADTCCETLIISSSGGTAYYQGARLGTYKKDGEHNNKPVYKQQQGSKILFFSGFEWVVGSSFNSGGGLRSRPGEDPACPSDAKQWEYYVPGTSNTWIVDSAAGVDCKEGISDCRAATKADCPTEHTFLDGGFTTIPYDGMLDSSHDVDTKCACRHLCDVRPTECKSFLFKTCSKGLEPRCILLNVDEPATTTPSRYKKHFAFCRRDLLVKKWRRRNGNNIIDNREVRKFSINDGNNVEQFDEEVGDKMYKGTKGNYLFAYQDNTWAVGKPNTNGEVDRNKMEIIYKTSTNHDNVQDLSKAIWLRPTYNDDSGWEEINIHFLFDDVEPKPCAQDAFPAAATGSITMYDYGLVPNRCNTAAIQPRKVVYTDGIGNDGSFLGVFKDDEGMFWGISKESKPLFRRASSPEDTFKNIYEIKSLMWKAVGVKRERGLLFVINDWQDPKEDPLDRKYLEALWGGRDLGIEGSAPDKTSENTGRWFENFNLKADEVTPDTTFVKWNNLNNNADILKAAFERNKGILHIGDIFPRKLVPNYVAMCLTAGSAIPKEFRAPFGNNFILFGLNKLSPGATAADVNEVRYYNIVDFSFSDEEKVPMENIEQSVHNFQDYYKGILKLAHDVFGQPKGEEYEPVLILGGKRPLSATLSWKKKPD